MRKKKIDLMGFDLDGTLVASGDDLAAAVNFTLGKIGLPLKRNEEIMGFVGDGVRKLLERAAAVNQEKILEKALEIFSDYYEKHLLDSTRLYPHVLDVLNNYSGKTKVVVTNKRYKYAMSIVQGLSIDMHFDDIIGADTFPYQKPDARLVAHLLNKYNIDKSKAVMIGDGINDILLAKNSGILSVAHLSGLGKKEDLLAAQADYYCESMDEIVSLFA
ncbi:MAG TPA: HAD-IA family hydrolase [Smithellaceae bacterium]|nr:HAD-IA family hydrolase [Smithellaceae bacterium]HRS89187.1 HAD-IA family hydrolase [Smithellaceae bacterium]HRV26111.1 HAD-IA family hydrolase [Smithellaceae bacterium]